MKRLGSVAVASSSDAVLLADKFRLLLRPRKDYFCFWVHNSHADRNNSSRWLLHAFCFCRFAGSHTRSLLSMVGAAATFGFFLNSTVALSLQSWTPKEKRRRLLGLLPRHWNWESLHEGNSSPPEQVLAQMVAMWVVEAGSRGAGLSSCVSGGRAALALFTARGMNTSYFGPRRTMPRAAGCLLGSTNGGAFLTDWG